MVQLFNTLTHKKEEFESIKKQQVGIYTCGPTVYNFAHIGNLRAYIFADILKRMLTENGYSVKHIMNITDVGHLTGDRDMGEDKIEKAAAAGGKNAWDIASYYTEAFLSDIKKLNIILPDKLPKATDHIKDMIKIIKVLDKNGFTYRTTDGIYFDTSKLPDYGKLARLDLEGLKEGARVEPNPEKKNPTDFALWKFSPKDVKRQMEWESPWGIGFPGWHIECSAMSVKYLGQPFDIHTGGIDHIPVHHTNEIAQSEAAYGKPLANFWLHSEFVMLDTGRIGKSEGNALTLEEVQKKGFSTLAYRYFVLQGHYRNKLNFTWEAMESAQNSLDSLYESVADAKKPGKAISEFEESFFAAVSDDLDTPRALSVMWEMLRSDHSPETKLQTLFAMDKILGLSVKETIEAQSQPIPKDIQTLVKTREQARLADDWKKADELREEIEKLGFEVRDLDTGSKITRKLH